MSTPMTLDPEVHAILNEVVSDPGSSFLRRTPFRTPCRTQAPVTHRDSTLTRAERKLVTVYRHELHYLLLLKVQDLVLDWNARDGKLLRYWSNDWELRSHSASNDYSSRVTRNLGITSTTPVERCARKLLATDLHATSALSSTQAIHMASTALRLVPSDTARIYLGLVLFQANQPQSAQSVLRQVLEGDSNPLTRSQALQNIGMIRGAMKDTAGSMVANREAAYAADNRGDPAMSWYADALFSGDADQALLAAAVIADRLPTDHPSIEAFLGLNRFSRAGRIKRNDSAETMKRTFREVEHQVQEQAWRIGHALLSIR